MRYDQVLFHRFLLAETLTVLGGSHLNVVAGSDVVVAVERRITRG